MFQIITGINDISRPVQDFIPRATEEAEEVYENEVDSLEFHIE